MNHSFVKSISLSGYPLPRYSVLFISELLFDLDPDVDFMIQSQISGTSIPSTLIYHENGSLILRVDSMYPNIYVNDSRVQCPIYNTSYGTKMILENPSNSKANVYSLLGTLNASIQDANDAILSRCKISNAYPNPSSSTTKIDYSLPMGIDKGEIVFFDLAGKEVKRYKVDKTFNTLLISTSDITSGNYYYQLQTTEQFSEGKKLIVIK